MKTRFYFIRMTFILCLSFFSLTLWSDNEGKELNIVFIGNSITQGVLLENPEKQAPPVKCVNWLETQLDVEKISFFNAGRSGCTTVDFLPETNNLFPWMKIEADKLAKNKGILLFSIMLGGNDSAISGPKGAPVEAEQYRENMRKIINKLLDLYPKAVIVLNDPLWYSPNTYNGAMYLVAGQKRLLEYIPELRRLVGEYAQIFPGQVKTGDTEAYKYFKEYYQTDMVAEDGNAGVFYLHPNDKGGSRLAEYWGQAILRAIGKE